MVFLHQVVVCLNIIRVERNAVNGTYLPALWGIKMAHAFGALIGINLINFNPHKNGIIRALWLTDVAIDALICNQ
jgi:hypothetical protein